MRMIANDYRVMQTGPGPFTNHGPNKLEHTCQRKVGGGGDRVQYPMLDTNAKCTVLHGGDEEIEKRECHVCVCSLLTEMQAGMGEQEKEEGNQ